MGLAANQFNLLFLTAQKSDIEFKMFNLNRERVALMDAAAKLAAEFADTIFDSGQHSDLYDGQIPGMIPGFIGGISNPFIDPPEVNPIPRGEYEAKMMNIHAMDRDLELQVKKLQTFHEAKKTEIDSVKELLNNNTEKEFSTFS